MPLTANSCLTDYRTYSTYPEQGNGTAYVV